MRRRHRRRRGRVRPGAVRVRRRRWHDHGRPGADGHRGHQRHHRPGYGYDRRHDDPDPAVDNGDDRRNFAMIARPARLLAVVAVAVAVVPVTGPELSRQALTLATDAVAGWADGRALLVIVEDAV